MNDHLAAVVQFNSGILETKSSSEGVSTDTNQDDIDIKCAL